MKNPNLIEEVYANLDIVQGLGLAEDLDVLEALNHGASPDFSVVVDDGEPLVFGNTIDEVEYEDLGLRVTTERGLGYYASYSSVLPASLMG